MKYLSCTEITCVNLGSVIEQGIKDRDSYILDVSVWTVKCINHYIVCMSI